MSISTNTNKTNYINPSTGAIIGGVIAGGAANNITLYSHGLIANRITKNLQKLSSSLTQDEFVQIESAISSALKKSGVEAKGVSIIKSTLQNAEEILKILNKGFDKGVFKYLPKFIKELTITSYLDQLKKGTNAFFYIKENKIIRPEKGVELALFHEIGHSINKNCSKVGKFLQKCRFLILLTLPISIIALFKTKKAPDEKPKTSTDKATTFIKNNAGKLTFAAFLPILLEEGLATIRGNKLAKETLNTDLAKKVAKTNALGFSTYLLFATLSSLGVFLSTKIKDAIANKKIKTENT